MGNPSPELLQKALRKITAALDGVKQKAAAVGATACLSWGVDRAPEGLELLLAGGEAALEPVLGAARGEGLQQTPGGDPLQLRYSDAKLGGPAPVRLLLATTPFHKRILERAQPGAVLQVSLLVATCEDLILSAVASESQPERDLAVDLLRRNAARIDGVYVKNEAQAAGTLDRLKSAWQAAKAQA